jgi:uncharacterized membrane protein
MKKLPFYAYIFLLGVALSQAVYYYPVMPEWMASHFAGSGKADNWMSKDVFFIVVAVMQIFMIGTFLVMPWTFEKFKIRKMNLPNRDYWLAPERRDIVYRYFRTSFGWFGVANLILMIGVLQLVFNANLTSNPVLDNRVFLIFLGSYFVFVIIWLITFFRKFNRVG